MVALVSKKRAAIPLPSILRTSLRKGAQAVCTLALALLLAHLVICTLAISPALRIISVLHMANVFLSPILIAMIRTTEESLERARRLCSARNGFEMEWPCLKCMKLAVG